MQYNSALSYTYYSLRENTPYPVDRMKLIAKPLGSQPSSTASEQGSELSQPATWVEWSSTRATIEEMFQA